LSCWAGISFLDKQRVAAVAGLVGRRERGTGRGLWAASALLCAAFALAACGDISRFQTASPTPSPKPNRTVVQTPAAEREHERTRAVVHRHPVVRIRELQPEQDLRHVMTARRELVEHLALGHEAGLLDVVEGARSVHERDDADPVGRVAGRLWCA